MLRPLLLIFTLLMPSLLTAQVTERAPLPTSQRFTNGERVQRAPVERHYTMELLGSPEGRETLQRYTDLRDRGLAPRRVPLFQNEIGDVETFFVRNPDESEDEDPVFEEVDFRLSRSDGNVEIWVEVEELGDDKISNAILDIIMTGLIDSTPPNSVDPGRGIVEIVRDLFGEQPNKDGSGTLKILITDIEDGWDPEEQPTFIAGFFDPVNLLPVEEHENSNEADIIYINSTPGIYRDGMFVSPRLSTMAHEFQHLIHAGYGGFLTLFQNEAQSELSEILTGYSSRRMTFLNSPSEVSGNVDTPEGWIYRFRSDDPDVVLFDYQRAQLLHSYLDERVGPEAAASLTSNVEAGSGSAAYEAVLTPEGITLEEFLSDFYVSNYANNLVEGGPQFGYSRPQFINVQVDNPGVIYDAEMQDWIYNRVDTLYYGGAHYTQWFGVDDLTLEIGASEGVSQQLLYRRAGETTFQWMELGEGVITLDEPGIYEEIVLVSVNVEMTQGNPGDFRTYTYSGEWTSTDLVLETLSYHSTPSSFYPIPENDLFAFALRISPDFDSGVQSVGININTRETAVQGEGELALNLREAVTDGELFYPGAILATQTFSPTDLAAGENFIGVSTTDWAVREGVEYFVSLEVVEDLGGLYIELLLDEGTLSETDPDYNPPRTFAGFQEGGDLVGWGYFQQPEGECVPSEEDPCTFHHNLVMSVNLVGSREGDGSPDGPGRPISRQFELAENYPNPFRGQTTIDINIPEPALVAITVHDILGREVYTILDDEVPVGFHSIPFDASRLSSGVYFYRMNARGVSGDRFSGVRAMTVIR